MAININSNSNIWMSWEFLSPAFPADISTETLVCQLCSRLLAAHLKASCAAIIKMSHALQVHSVPLLLTRQKKQVRRRRPSKRGEKKGNSILIKGCLRHYHHQSYSQLPNFSGQEWKSMGKSSRCIGHSACTVNLHPIHRKLKRLCKRMESKQHRLGTLPRKLKKKKKRNKLNREKKELTSLMHYSRLCICNALKQKKNNSSC